MKADGSGDSSEQAQEKSESEAAEQKQTSDEGVQGQSGPRQPVGDGVANRRTDTEQAELGNLLDYARMAFDRAYGHIVALGERFNLIAATSSVLMVALLTVVLLSDIFHRSSEKEAVVTAIAKLSMAGMSCLVLSILFCLVSVFRSVGPDRSEADQSRDFFPLTHDMRSDRHLIDEVIRYMGPATREMRLRHILVCCAAVMLLLGILIVAIVFAVVLALLVGFDPECMWSLIRHALGFN